MFLLKGENFLIMMKAKCNEIHLSTLMQLKTLICSLDTKKVFDQVK